MKTDDPRSNAPASAPIHSPSPAWLMDQDGPVDWAVDVPIPFRLSGDHERGAHLDEVAPDGFVP